MPHSDISQSFFDGFDPIAQNEAMEYAARKFTGANLERALIRSMFFRDETNIDAPDPAPESGLQVPPFPIMTGDYRLSSDPPADTPTLILCVGLPRSGKSTWSKANGSPIVCPDAIRLSLHGLPFVSTAEPTVWATARLMVASLFLSGHMTVILDACNVSRKRRAEWIDNRWQCVYAVFPTKPEECIRRARETGREDIIPVIERMDRDFEPVSVAVNERERD